MLDQVDFNWKNPDYTKVFKQRIERIQIIRADPSVLPDLKAYYRDNPADFINDWGVTFDPRRVEQGLPGEIPFILFPRQREFLDWILGHWRESTPGLAEKSRDSGMSWLTIGLGCTLCLHYEGMAIGFGSRKEEYVDKLNSPKSLFWKARLFMQRLPTEFRGGWDLARDAPYMRINFPATGSYMVGEAGDQIGRGDRESIYVVDESAFLEQAENVERSLSQTTNCRIDISTPNGIGNVFEQKRHSGKIDVFTFHWRDDPRKDQAWYDKQVRELDPVTVAQEIDIDYSASVEGVVIPHAWILASIDAHLVLGIKPTGAKFGALDIADEGKDQNAFSGGQGILVEYCDEWTGKGADIFSTVQKAFDLCDELGYPMFRYDGDGLGAGARGDARIINKRRREAGAQELQVVAFRGSEGVVRPEAEDEKGRKNKDYFLNCKAQSWWSVRQRFRNTYRWVVEKIPCHPDEIISISSKIPKKMKLVSELSQPTYSMNAVGKMVIDKAPEGSRSPNMADSVVIKFGKVKPGPLKISGEVLAAMGRRTR